jgi:3-deoxy-D-manno-octulosonic-acid transferase
MSLLRRLYNLVFPLAFLVLLPGYLRRMVRRGNYRRAFGQRLGYYTPAVRARLANSPGRPWIQAVSVGEMLVALKLIAAWRSRCPGQPLILSATTTTGFALARERAGPDVEVIYTPIDAAGCVRRAFAALQPGRVIIVDGGLWPNLLWTARARSVHVSLVNARLSPRSERRWRRFSVAARPIMELLDLVCVADPGDVARWESLGVPAGRVQQTGSVKFDDQPPSPNSAFGSDSTVAALHAYLGHLDIAPGTPILLAGSTHPGEERAVCEAFGRLRARFPELFLILAPRHVERARALLAELAVLELRIQARSQPVATEQEWPRVRPDVLLLDTTGELRDWYALATIVFIGKSLTAIGGQNPMEAIAAGRPVLFGPRMDNFQELAAELLAAGGAVQVQDVSSLEDACARLLGDPAARDRQASAASRLLARHAGAASRTVDLLLQAAPSG